MSDYDHISRHITEVVDLRGVKVEIEARWDWVGDNEKMSLRIGVLGQDRPSLLIDPIDGGSMPDLASALMTLAGLIAAGPVEVER